MQKFLTVGQVARRLHLSEDTVRALADEREIPSQRTTGGHRRFPEAAVDRYEARSGPAPRRSRPTPLKRRRPTAGAPLFDDVDEEVEMFEELTDIPEEEPPGDRFAGGLLPAQPDLSAIRDVKPDGEQERRRTAAAEATRLQALKTYGVGSIPYDIPAAVRSRIVEELESYVTSERLPAWVTAGEQRTLVKGRVEAIVEAHRKKVKEEAGQKQADEARRVAEDRARRAAAEAATLAKAKANRRVRELVDHGKQYAEDELREFNALDRWTLGSEIEKALAEEVDADWSECEVEDLVDEFLGEEDDDDDEAD